MPSSLSIRHVVTVFMVVLLIALQAQLWLGRGSVPQVREMRTQLSELEQQAKSQSFDNERLRAEVDDLLAGLAAAEDKARSGLGMVKPNEIFVQITK